jgi:hypothetical protein
MIKKSSDKIQYRLLQSENQIKIITITINYNISFEAFLPNIAMLLNYLKGTEGINKEVC